MGEIKSLAEKKKNVQSLIESERFKDQVAKALPNMVSGDQFIRTTLSTVYATPKLLECTQESLLGAILVCAQLGLKPELVLGQAYIIPYGNKATFILGYKGMIELARRSGEIKEIYAHVVYANDHFKYILGTENKIEHSPAEGDRGELVKVYGVAKFKSGGLQLEVMSKDEVDAIRARSKAGKSGPWVTDYNEMAKKTVIRRMWKYLPASVDSQLAVAQDEAEDLGYATEFKVTSTTPNATLDDLANELIKTPDDEQKSHGEEELAKEMEMFE